MSDLRAAEKKRLDGKKQRSLKKAAAVAKLQEPRTPDSSNDRKIRINKARTDTMRKVDVLNKMGALKKR